MSFATEMFGDLIDSYSRAQAIEDGTLIDVSEIANEAGFTIPVAVTQAVWHDYMRSGSHPGQKGTNLFCYQ